MLRLYAVNEDRGIKVSIGFFPTFKSVDAALRRPSIAKKIAAIVGEDWGGEVVEREDGVEYTPDPCGNWVELSKVGD